MGIISEFKHLKKALVLSLIIHFVLVGLAASTPFFRRRIIYSAPLFVDLVRMPPPVATKKKEKEKAVYKEPKKEKPKKKEEVKQKPKKKEKVKEEPKKEKKEEKKEEPKKETAETEEEKKEPKSGPLLPRGKISVEAAIFPFTYYLTIIQEKITENWTPWGEDQPSGEVVIYFRILKDGRISHIQVETSSGNQSLDQSALRAVALTRLPGLPQEFEYDFLAVHFGFSLETED